jgi:hypothetical protein
VIVADIGGGLESVRDLVSGFDWGTFAAFMAGTVVSLYGVRLQNRSQEGVARDVFQADAAARLQDELVLLHHVASESHDHAQSWDEAVAAGTSQSDEAQRARRQHEEEAGRVEQLSVSALSFSTRLRNPPLRKEAQVVVNALRKHGSNGDDEDALPLDTAMIQRHARLIGKLGAFARGPTQYERDQANAQRP